MEHRDSRTTERPTTFRFSDFALDTQLFELREDGRRVPVEPQVFDLLRLLIENRDRIVAKDEIVDCIWGGRVISETALTSRVNAARRAVGDDGRRQAVIKTVPRRGYRFILPVSAEGGQRSAPDAPADDGGLVDHSAHQEIRFCTACDGVRIAYATVGEGPPLVKAASWLSHLEFDWESPVWIRFLHELAADHLLVRYDERGTALSDWDVADISFEAFVLDLEAVVDAAGIDRFDLLGFSHGCPVAAAYAVRHPERVRRLVLYGGFARGRSQRDDPLLAEQQEAIRTLIRQGWANDNPAFRQIFTSQMLPEGNADEISWFNDLQRMSASPENAVRIRDAVNQIDVTDILPKVTKPTLVIHRRGDATTPFEEGRRMAAMIPGARFVVLEGRNHVVLEHETEWPRFIGEIKNFLTEG